MHHNPPSTLTDGVPSPGARAENLPRLALPGRTEPNCASDLWALVRRLSASIQTGSLPDGIGPVEQMATHTVEPNRLGRAARLFLLGDACFLILVGVLSTLIMQLAHEWQWGFLLAFSAGMALAMIVQTLLALLVAPVLGSIESMVPSMVVAMVSPMSVCALHGIGCEPTTWVAGLLGAIFGLGTLSFVMIYARASRRWAAAFRGG